MSQVVIIVMGIYDNVHCYVEFQLNISVCLPFTLHIGTYIFYVIYRFITYNTIYPCYVFYILHRKVTDPYSLENRSTQIYQGVREAER